MRSADPWWAVRLAGLSDPISLEPLATLPYTPFELRADPSTPSDSDWFDGRTLAMYLATSRRFAHPMSRRELSREECSALDTHLKANRIASGIPEVAKIFDRHREEVRSGSAAEPSTMRASEADVYAALFAGSRNAAPSGTAQARQGIRI